MQPALVPSISCRKPSKPRQSYVIIQYVCPFVTFECYLSRMFFWRLFCAFIYCEGVSISANKFAKAKRIILKILIKHLRYHLQLLRMLNVGLLTLLYIFKLRN